MKRYHLILLAVLALGMTRALPVPAADTAAAPRIQVVLLLDTSNSMDGLIDQAKTQLWKIVNEFVTAEKKGQRPEFLVALYEYGNDGLAASEGHIRQILPFTNDLDRVSQELFALQTNGGQEYCGRVIKAAVDQLDWSPDHNDLKAVFIAGNEPFTQGEVDYKISCKSSIEKGITVNTIFCGPWQTGVDTDWKAGADLADGSYMNIDQNMKAVHINAPQDDEIARLGGELNQTYIPYGTRGTVAYENQAMQDANAAGAAPGSMTQRAVSKASAFYSNESWDLVDAVEKDGEILKEMDSGDLPDTMRGMSLEERRKYVEDKKAERERIQAEIQRLNEERKKYVAEQQKKLAETGEDTLDAALIKTIRQQAVDKGFQFE